jgi:hypothetical protein
MKWAIVLGFPHAKLDPSMGYFHIFGRFFMTHGTPSF